MAIEQKLLHQNIGESTQLDRAIVQSLSLEELGRPIFTPEERKDHGVIEYTTVANTVLHWAEDPFGKKKFEAISSMYGISYQNVLELLSHDPDMQHYVKAKQEGRFVGMVSTQVYKPSLYFMMNALILAQLHKRGIPVALMLLDYGSDTFFAMNSDKGGAFGKIEFPIGKNQEGVLQTVQFSLKPAGYIADDGKIVSLPKMRIEDANGLSCNQILVKIDMAADSHAKKYPNREGLESEKRPDGSIIEYDETKAFLKASLGIDCSAEYITLTDFYKLLWNKAIDRLRQLGELPSEEEMPTFFVDKTRLYTEMVEQANPPIQTMESLKFDNDEHILRDVLHLHLNPKFGETVVRKALEQGKVAVEALLAKTNLRMKNNLLIHRNGMMDAATYYPAQLVWPDLYLECSSCGGDKFVSKLARAQQLRHMMNVPEVEVRLPDVEIPELEAYLVHPGSYVDRLATQVHVEELLAKMGQEIATIAAAVKEGKIDKDSGRRKSSVINDEIKQLRENARKELYRQILVEDPEIFRKSAFALPEVVIALLKKYLTGVDEAIAMIQ